MEGFRALHERAEREKLRGVPLPSSAFDSGCPIVIRYLCRQEPWLAQCHTVFHDLSMSLSSMLQYFSKMLAEDEATDEVPDTLHSYKWDEGQFKLLLGGRFHEMQFVNKPGGYLAVMELRTLRCWNDVSKEQQFALPSTLKEVAKWMHRLTCALGHDPESTEGYSAKAVIDKLIEYQEFGDALPDAASEWQQYGVTNLESALRRAGRQFDIRIYSAQPSEERRPEMRLSDFLPADKPFFDNLSHRMERSETLTTVMQAMPGLIGSQAPRTVLGATAPTGSGTKRGAAEDKDKPPKSTSGGAPKRPKEAAGPGSKFGHGKLAS
jgi:hypothetical protein